MVISHDKVQKAFQHLKDAGKVHSQQDLADAMGKNKSYVSKHINSEKGASDVFVREMCKAFPGMFNLNYFLTGEGSMLIEVPKNDPSAFNDMIITKLIEQNSKLMQQFLEREREASDRMAQMDAQLKEVREALAKLERAYRGYASIAADTGGVVIKQMEEEKK